MKIDFNRQINRKNTDCSKWDGQGGDYIPLWVADMDFPVAEPVLEALKKRLEHPFFGYTFPGESVYQAVISYYKRRYDFDVKKEWILFNHGVNTGNNIAARALGGTIMVATPMYPHINQKLPQEAGKPVIRVPLKQENGLYTFDFEAMEKAVTQDVTTFVLCNPHNPAGRVWTKEELLEVAKIAERHELYIISDEIHADFVYGGKHHTPMASVSEYAMEHTITAFAPSKTFNVAGLCQSYVVIPNKKLYNAYDATYNAFDLGDNVFGMTALTAAYTKGEEWLTEMLQYLEANRDFTVEYIRENIPEISVWSPEGTYLLWLDCSKLNLENDELNQFFLEKAKVKMNPGYRFGAQCSTYMRLNIGCPRAQLQEALARIEKAIKNR